MAGGRGADRTDGVVCTPYRARACNDKSLLPAQYPSPLTLGSRWCWSVVTRMCAATDHVLLVGQSRLHSRTTRTQDRVEDLWSAAQGLERNPTHSVQHRASQTWVTCVRW